MKSRPILVTVILTVLLVWPLLGVPADFVSTAILAAQYLIVALSLVLLIGLVGQISLCQASLVGMGAFTTALAIRHLSIPFPFVLLIGIASGALTATVLGVVALRVRGLYLAVATLIFAYVADNYLFAQPWLVQSQSGTSISGQTVGRKGLLPYLDLSKAHTFYYVALAVAAIVLYSVANMRESRVGRAWAAIRGSEVAAASLGIDVMRFKLIAFATSGAIAGLGGSLTMIGQRTVAPDQFNFIASLYFLGIAVVAGLRSLGGAIASSVMFALLVGELFFRFPTLANYLDVISAVVLILVLLFFRGGFGAVPGRVRVISARLDVRARYERSIAPRLRPLVQRVADLRAARADRRASEPLAEQGPESRSGWRRLLAKAKRGSSRDGSVPGPAGDGALAPLDVVAVVDRLIPKPAPVEPIELASHRPDPSAEAPAVEMGSLLEMAGGAATVAGELGPDGRRVPLLLSAEHITVKFGGLTAVSDASMQVGAGEIVGLIGPNGAGKTTLFNSVLGLNQPADGMVHLYDRDVTKLAVHQRAALGVGRTFQVLQLFGDLTVYDNLLVATHLQNSTGLMGSVIVTGSARRQERAARERVEAVLRLMELDVHADRQVAGLPFGVLRLIEVARTMVTGARLVCFDEPASGLDSTETERLIEWFQFLRQIGTTLLVIEHDVSMVVRLCDYIYVLDQGKMIAEGTPAQVQRDPHVVASYLGTAVEVAS